MTRQRAAWWLFSTLVAAFLLYLPGLHGTFLFDDFPNIVDNTALHVTQSSMQAWLQAAWASPSSDLQRPLASLSFGLNHYFTGLDPWWMKATNLAIHLLNGLLLYTLLRRICKQGSSAQEAQQRSHWLALAVSGVWLLHPINLTAVLFVVQRMESLAQVFVLAGLLLYVEARQRQARGEPGFNWRLWLGVPCCTVLGIASKESAALLPLYALLLELTVLRLLPRKRHELSLFFLVFLIVPGLLGLAWLLPRSITDAAYAHRAFTLGERLLTEPRVLMDYATWTLLPLPGFFSFYRDDYVISTSLLQPWTTLPAILAVGVMLLAAWMLRARRPLVALGLAWFLAAHALTATFFPLELVFEHRNYFASIGLLLAAFDLLLPRRTDVPLALAGYVAIGAILLLSALSLGLRAKVWGDPIRFAVTEAALHPSSPRATYDLGRTYVVLSGYRKDSPFLYPALDALQSATSVARASVLPEVALIIMASRTERPIDNAWWDGMVSKLKQHPPTAEDAAAIKSLTSCQREGHCKPDDQHMLQLFLATIGHKTINPAILYSYAIFAQNRLHDSKLALQLARDAARSRNLQYHVNLINFMMDLGDKEGATLEMNILNNRSRAGQMAFEIKKIQERLTEMTSRTP